MEISYDEITDMKLIDGGNYGDVYKEKEDFPREIENLKKLEHTNIVKLYGVSKDPENKICIVLEYAECGSLYKYLHITQNHIPNDLKIEWMLQCAEGMEYLHSKKTFHRDLKTKNLLLFDQYRTLKICDFGTVKEITTTNTNNTGTAGYMAPEVGEGKIYTQMCDVYSFGIVFWEVLARKKPFYHHKSIVGVALINKVCKGERPEMSDIENNLKPIIKMCWQQEPEDRLTMKRVIYLIQNYKKNRLYQ
ncbi:mitogen-activated protein kinase kinase kinase 7-like isoform X2 [Drosophila albomicans]|uniref:Mitogen-activated protein kinase kinase kinase 7-like isoform X2 n=1 Tax=Drosophila albomicans TaxID=7291 RepID=A0A9C6SXV7_DROAB|nr:mitogen-activated protein kinase kinase kinase 7-like isoform X2 [Drosophila albomicans]